jgi:hypothetical protein
MLWAGIFCVVFGVVVVRVVIFFKAGSRQHRRRIGRTRAAAGSRREHGYHDIRS